MLVVAVVLRLHLLEPNGAEIGSGHIGSHVPSDRFGNSVVTSVR